jgi:Na+-transporting NADH:ubiquinone oxidoreductase subunit NqrE
VLCISIPVSILGVAVVIPFAVVSEFVTPGWMNFILFIVVVAIIITFLNLKKPQQ